MPIFTKKTQKPKKIILSSFGDRVQSGQSYNQLLSVASSSKRIKCIQKNPNMIEHTVSELQFSKGCQFAHIMLGITKSPSQSLECPLNISDPWFQHMQAQHEIIICGFKYSRTFYSLPSFLEDTKKFGQKFSEESGFRTPSALRTPSQEAGRQTIKRKSF